VSPLAVPVLLEVGRESVAHGAAEDALLAEAEEAALIAEAMEEDETPLPHAVPGPQRKPARQRQLL
jgi:ATP-dependent Lhr-like helicase